VTFDSNYPNDEFFCAVLSGKLLTLEPYSEDRDFYKIADLLSDARVTEPMGIPVPNPYIPQLNIAKKERMESSDSGDWTIFLNENKEDEQKIFAGETGIANWNPEARIVEIFTAIHPDFYGKGFGREATAILIKHIFSHDPIVKIRTQALETNMASIKMALKLGFRESGRRFVGPDPGRGFIGGIAVIMDLISHNFIVPK